MHTHTYGYTEGTTHTHIHTRTHTRTHTRAPQVYQNWIHAHALDESAINYDGISIVRLVALLRLGASDNPDIASFPLGPSDLGSGEFKAFLYE